MVLFQEYTNLSKKLQEGAMSYQRMKLNIITFITTLAEKTALPLPGHLPQFHNYKVMKLPSSETKNSVYQQYKKAKTEVTGDDVISLISFRKIWRDCCPNVTTMKPADDLCDICRQNNLDIIQAANLDDESKEAQLLKVMDHLKAANVQREYYNSWRQKAKSAEQETLVVASFNFAQNVSFPSSPQQVGSSYFKALRKCSIFGVQNEATQVQTNFLIDKEDSAGKGANSVISMLHCYLEKMQSAKDLVLFADNCVGQNKNNAMIHYLIWRVLCGRNKKIILNFLLTGHTKFSPDRNFGILKSKYSRANVDCTQDFIEVVNTSSPNGYNIALPSIDPNTKNRNDQWYEWDSSLRCHFKPIPGVTKYHHFEIDSDFHAIKAKLFADSPEIIIYEFEPSFDIQNMSLKKITPAGLTNEREWYLYDQIRNLCNREESKDSVAPKPKIAKNKKQDQVAPEPKIATNKKKDSVTPEPKIAKTKKKDSVAPEPKIVKTKKKDSVAPELKIAKAKRKASVAHEPKIDKNKKKRKPSD